MQEHLLNRSAGTLATWEVPDPGHTCPFTCAWTQQPQESASTWAAPSFWGFLATWTSLNVPCCTAKLVWCHWVTCPWQGKALELSCSPARAILWLCWARVTGVAAKPQLAVQWVAHTHNTKVIQSFPFSGIFQTPPSIILNRALDCFSSYLLPIRFLTSVWHFYSSKLYCKVIKDKNICTLLNKENKSYWNPWWRILTTVFEVLGLQFVYIIVCCRLKCWISNITYQISAKKNGIRKVTCSWVDRVSARIFGASTMRTLRTQSSSKNM